MTKIQNTEQNIILERFKNQKAYFATGETRDVEFRIKQLKTLKEAINKYTDKLNQALWEDLRKSPEEVYTTEISIVLGDIDNHINHIREWVEPKVVPTPLPFFPSSSKVIYEPLGVSLIIAPFNYPFNLLFSPFIGAISSGCCAFLKPSPKTKATSMVMQEMIEEYFDPKYVTMVQGNHEVNQLLWSQPFDFIFFTGSSKVGKIVMKAASENLVPLILELGGKSPTIVDKSADIDTAARRIVWGKYINSGQTCIAPDYVYVHEDIKDEFLKKMVYYIKEAYGEKAEDSEYYCQIIDDRAMTRISAYLNDGKVYYGGRFDAENRFIEPTILTDVSPSEPVMQNEIFGPILPVMTFKDIKEPIDFINSRPKPLAFYYFGDHKEAQNVLDKTSSGGCCVNDTLMHLINHNLPFGGVGNSGLGKYHGHYSFLAFSNQRGCVTTPTVIDIPLKYAPYKHFGLTKKLLSI